MNSKQNSFENTFEVLRQTILDKDEEGDHRKSDLRPIEEIPHPYQQVFSRLAGFNMIQSKVLDDVFYGGLNRKVDMIKDLTQVFLDDSMVVCAPTGSGKTVIFELAIVRLLINLERLHTSDTFKIVYICPMKALCEERLVDWHKKFSTFGINSISVTGDSDNFEFQNLVQHNLIITTPEKWDCLTRKWRDNRNIMQDIKMFLIDEIHLLGEDNRGSTLEAVVCRMKTIEQTLHSQRTDSDQKIRFVAASATIANIADVAEWLGKSAKHYRFSEEHRPVKLNKIVLGYSHASYSSHFKFDLALNYKLPLLIMQHSHGKPTLIFCSTRKIVEMTAKHLLQHVTINLKPDQKLKIVDTIKSISDANIKASLIHGVGYHHAGMLPETRKVVEELFRNGELPILVTTSTLAVGVNLPAHLVVVKSTKCYTNNGFKDYTETSLLQMIGRAGRPQFDTEATALILTTSSDKEKFERMIGGTEPIESNLHKHLTEHLNAEVVLQTITDLEVAMRWLSSTFLYIRARKNPKHYGFTADPASIDQKLLEMCKIELNKLITAEMITIDENVVLKATPIGAAMAKYYLAFETMKLFTLITGHEILQQILALISKCHEFSEMYLRVNDKKCLNLLNKCRNGQTIRFPLNGKIKTLDMKINCIIQAVLGCLDICDHSILSEAFKIMRNGERIVKCLAEYLETKDTCFQALLSAVILAKCFHVQLWENSPYVSKQLPGIGIVMSSQLVKAGKTTFQSILECDPREIEMIINKKPPAGDNILEKVKYLPRYTMTLEKMGNNLELSVTLENYDELRDCCSLNSNSLMMLLIGDSLNNILLYEKFSHSYMIENRTITRSIPMTRSSECFEAHFISEDWVGIDCQEAFSLVPNGKTAPTSKKSKKDNLTHMQKFMEIYMKIKERSVPATNIAKNHTEAKRKKSKEVDESNKILIHSDIRIVPDEEDENESQFSNSGPSETPNLQSLHKSVVNLSQKYKFTPKRISHTSGSVHNSTQTESDSKPVKIQSKITWRSPLTYSPPVKFSPKLTCLPEIAPRDLIKSPSVAAKIPPRQQLTQLLLPLSDKDCADTSVEESNDSRSNILETVGDIVSTSFLENVGLLSQRTTKIQTPIQYYDKLMSQNRSPTERKLKHGSRNLLNATQINSLGVKRNLNESFEGELNGSVQAICCRSVQERSERSTPSASSCDHAQICSKSLDEISINRSFAPSISSKRSAPVSLEELCNKRSAPRRIEQASGAPRSIDERYNQRRYVPITIGHDDDTNHPFFEYGDNRASYQQLSRPRVTKTYITAPEKRSCYQTPNNQLLGYNQLEDTRQRHNLQQSPQKSLTSRYFNDSFGSQVAFMPVNNNLHCKNMRQWSNESVANEPMQSFHNRSLVQKDDFERRETNLLSNRTKSNQTVFSMASFDNMSDKVDFFSPDWQNCQDEDSQETSHIFERSQTEDQFLQKSPHVMFDDSREEYLRPSLGSQRGQYAETCFPSNCKPLEKSPLSDFNTNDLFNDSFDSLIRDTELLPEIDSEPNKGAQFDVMPDAKQESMFENRKENFYNRSGCYVPDDTSNMEGSFSRRNWHHYHRPTTEMNDIISKTPRPMSTPNYFRVSERYSPYPVERQIESEGYRYLRRIMENEDYPQRFEKYRNVGNFRSSAISETQTRRGNYEAEAKTRFWSQPFEKRENSFNYVSPTQRNVYCSEGKEYIMKKFLHYRSEDNE